MTGSLSTSLRPFLSMLRLFRPAVLIAGAFGLLVATAGSTEAGWFSWFRETDTRQLEQSLDVAREAARVASQAAEAQAQQAAAQADQNARLAETLGQLSNERSNLADHMQALAELGLKDSQWAAAINASGPVLICVMVLLVAGLALWLVSRPGDSQQAELAKAVDVLVEEITTYGPESGSGNHRGGRLTGPWHAHAAQALPRLPVLAGHGIDEFGPESMGPADNSPDDRSGPMPF